MPKKMLFGDEAKQSVMKGVNKIADAVATTLGAMGQNVMIEKNGVPNVTKDGVSVAKAITLKDRFENLGSNMIREVATKQVDASGDGTTTSTILAQTMSQLALAEISAGHNAVNLKRGMELASADALDLLDEMATPVTTREEIVRIATISANNDESIGNLIADAMEKVGNHGVVSVEVGNSSETELVVTEGLQFPKGMLNPYMSTNEEKVVAEYNNCYVVLANRPVSVNEISPILEFVANQKSPLLIIADDFSEDVVSVIIGNKMRGALSAVAVKSPSMGENRLGILKDIAKLTGANIISDQLGVGFGDVVFGIADKICVSRDSTLITGGRGDSDEFQTHINTLKAQIQNATSGFERDQLQERLSKLTGGVAVIRVGGYTEAEVGERKDRIDDALHATRSAVKEGWVVGGGIALKNISEELATKLPEVPEKYKVGYVTFANAMLRPFMQILLNAGKTQEDFEDEPELIGNLGYNALTDSVSDLVEDGVIDPVLVTKNAIKNATSIACLIATTNCLIVEDD